MILRIVRFTNLLLTSLIAGLAFGRVLNPSVKRLSAPARIEYQQAVDSDIAPIMRYLGPLTVLLNVANVLLLVRSFRTPAFPFTLGGLVGIVSFAVVTVKFEVPINEELQTWSSEEPPPDWAEKLDRWEWFHAVRTVTIVGGLCSLLLAVVSDARR